MLFIVYLVFSISGITLMKIGAEAPLTVELANKALHISAGTTTLIGLLCYICSFLIYTRLIATYDITYLVPVASAIVQIVVVGIALVFFKEQLTLLKSIGLALTLVGVLLMNIKR